MMVPVVPALFQLTEKEDNACRCARGSAPFEVLGHLYTVFPEPVPVELDRLLEPFRRVAHALAPVWEAFSSAESLDAIRAAAIGPAVALGGEARPR